MKRVFIVHGWDGSPEEGWFPWLKTELETRNFAVFVPPMPNADRPKIDEWVPHLSKLVREPDENTYFVGHSIGCQTVMRYLENISTRKIGGAVFVAGWFHLKNLEGPDEEKLAGPWLTIPINFEKLKTVAGKFLAILSDNDPYVPISDAEIFREKLGAEIIIEHGKGHLNGPADGVMELPIVLEKLLKMTEEK